MQRSERKRKRRRRQMDREEGDSSDDDVKDEKKEQSRRMKVAALNAKLKTKEDAMRCNYIQSYVLSSAWDSTVLLCLVNTLKRQWTFDVDATELDLFEEMREYLFVERD